ncbi:MULTISPECIES: SDR family NAD(P)-dependent oxidoreductase [Cupriavidus]|uniref:Short-chain dehydrogenase/reductase SDR n=1 Tax=Cupriavidus pinatubonensis (strain JMP 134 / LMG 1197) TaxID=264198 RepID=Q46N42_CUPPJ|nr:MULTISPECIES: glucose 1-dehydrogenase [Cupriavidus]QYY34085.1 glucose 1-dehydrogenase [Cupriavidus pinatubonensis]TPQ28562.1 3-oxoacyl-ACP reductase [Cupriavidus pinatubonensis]
MRDLDNKVVVVTGAAGGIGTAICRRFVDAGARVVAVDKDEDALQRLAEALRPLNAQLALLPLDITNHERVVSRIGSIAESLGGIDALVNNAGWDLPVQFLESSPEFWNKVIAINLVGPLNLHHAVLPHMISRGGGMVVNIASDAGRVGSSGEAVYSACKGGIIAFTKTIARECANHNIRVNTVCPGPTDTALLQSFGGDGEYGKKLYEGLKRAIPLKRLGKPEDVAGIVVFLSSPEAGFITGQTISVSGGLTMHG